MNLLEYWAMSKIAQEEWMEKQAKKLRTQREISDAKTKMDRVRKSKLQKATQAASPEPNWVKKNYPVVESRRKKHQVVISDNPLYSVGEKAVKRRRAIGRGVGLAALLGAGAAGMKSRSNRRAAASAAAAAAAKRLRGLRRAGMVGAGAAGLGGLAALAKRRRDER